MAGFMQEEREGGGDGDTAQEAAAAKRALQPRSFTSHMQPAPDKVAITRPTPSVPRKPSKRGLSAHPQTG
jgi:hypothetical protein